MSEPTTPSQKDVLKKSKGNQDLGKGIWFSRRNFLTMAGWAAFFGFFFTMLIGSIRMMFPRVLYEPSSKFKAGFPDTYTMGVSEKFLEKYKVWIVRDRDGFYALMAICTHLGCTPRWLGSEQKFKCPCHGSGFYLDGVNFEGPAPRPLERVQIAIGEDGQLLIDSAIKYLHEKGDWGKPGSFVKYS